MQKLNNIQTTNESKKKFSRPENCALEEQNRKDLENYFPLMFRLFETEKGKVLKHHDHIISFWINAFWEVLIY